MMLGFPFSSRRQWHSSPTFWVSLMGPVSLTIVIAPSFLVSFLPPRWPITWSSATFYPYPSISFPILASSPTVLLISLTSYPILSIPWPLPVLPLPFWSFLRSIPRSSFFLVSFPRATISATTSAWPVPMPVSTPTSSVGFASWTVSASTSSCVSIRTLSFRPIPRSIRTFAPAKQNKKSTKTYVTLYLMKLDI